jgi:hypothetical protein
VLLELGRASALASVMKIISCRYWLPLFVETNALRT